MGPAAEFHGIVPRVTHLYFPVRWAAFGIRFPTKTSIHRKRLQFETSLRKRGHHLSHLT